MTTIFVLWTMLLSDDGTVSRGPWRMQDSYATFIECKDTGIALANVHALKLRKDIKGTVKFICLPPGVMPR